jgi:hypothetical protein
MPSSQAPLCVRALDSQSKGLADVIPPPVAGALVDTGGRKSSPETHDTNNLRYTRRVEAVQSESTVNDHGTAIRTITYKVRLFYRSAVALREPYKNRQAASRLVVFRANSHRESALPEPLAKCSGVSKGLCRSRGHDLTGST